MKALLFRIISENEDLEQKMIAKAETIISKKLDKLPLDKLIQVCFIFKIIRIYKLLQDEDFIDSVFFRFATNQLPLRQGET